MGTITMRTQRGINTILFKLFQEGAIFLKRCFIIKVIYPAIKPVKMAIIIPEFSKRTKRPPTKPIMNPGFSAMDMAINAAITGIIINRRLGDN